MKKLICMITVLMMCLCLMTPVFAANDTFVPSISEKDHPDLVPTTDGALAMLCDDDGNVVALLNGDCILITPVSEAKTSTKIPENARKTLIDVYTGLTDGSMTIPYETDSEWVVRDLFDVSLLCEDHPAMMKQGVNLVVTFKLGIGAQTNVNVMVYADGQWYPAVKTVNNGDGTVTVSLDRVGTVAISVPAADIPKTGDDTNVMLWVALMAAAAVALVAVVIIRRKAVR